MNTNQLIGNGEIMFPKHLSLQAKIKKQQTKTHLTAKIKKQQTNTHLTAKQKSNKRSIVAILLLIAVICAGFSAPAGAASPSLKLTMIEQDPYPAQPGEQLRVWIQAENIGSGTLENVTIRVVQNSPFSISSGDSSKTYGYIYSGTKVYNEFFLSVAGDATKGPRDLKVQYRIDDGNWIETTFSINIGGVIDADSKGTLIVENVTSDPDVFMPGDSGIVWVTLKNNATSPTVAIANKTYETTARIQSIDLYSTDDIIVTSPAMDDLGIIAAGDTIKVPFRVSIPENLTDGTYLLTLNVTAGSYQYNIKRSVEIKVDSDGIRSIQSAEPKMNGTNTTVEIDIVNYHQGVVRGVTVIPEAEGMTFYPSEYFIGEMDPDDLYTAKFNVKSANAGFGAGNGTTATGGGSGGSMGTRPPGTMMVRLLNMLPVADAADPNNSNKSGQSGQTITLRTVYYNGDNKHEDVSTVTLSSFGGMQTVQKQSSLFSVKNMIIAIVVILIAAVGANYYLKKKKNTTLVNYSKEKFQDGKKKLNDWKQKRADSKQKK
ncbi:hypothetical protein [Methanolapillus millepedarum]|uniref:S-layer protein n=1 Tax=Methanolapillus millepedarum TaxID=3028296 RepID=A0AA96ZUU0_9EURY|nr:hypothetical protein MsAc7_16920 [Methanosarcinaceae archaeon Ac7]